MTNALTEPTVLVALIAVIGGVLTALVTLLVKWLERKLNLIGEATAVAATHAKQAKEQVANSHSTNLRDDMDRLHDDVRLILSRLDEHGSDLKRHGSEIGGIRTDLRIERQERMALAQRVDSPPVVVTNVTH